MRTLRSAFGLISVIGLIAGLSSDVTAKDLDLLTRLLAPAYIAHNFAAMCDTETATLTREQKNTLRDVGLFVDHVKTEVTTGLSEEEADKVRVTAANTARNVARHEMLFLGAQGRYVPTNILAQWCERSADTFISEILRAHVRKHEEFDRLTSSAKK